MPDLDGDAPAEHVSLPLPPKPTRHSPGTAGKVAVLAWRARHGYGLWHPDDATGEDAAASPPCRQRGPRGGGRPRERCRTLPKYVTWVKAKRCFRVMVPVRGEGRCVYGGKHQRLKDAVAVRDAIVDLL